MNKNPFAPDKAFALCIGVGRRGDDNPCMATTAADARRVEAELKGRVRMKPENVTGIYEQDATAAGIMAKLDSLIVQTITNAAEMVVVYFSGHGCYDKANDKYYLVANDTTSDVAATAISGAVFVSKLQALKADKVLVLLDCCHSGGVFSPAELPFDGSAFLAGPNRVIISASHAAQLSYVSSPLSVFTYALVEGLAGKFFEKGDTEVSLFGLAMYIRERVVSLSGSTKQRPQLNILKGVEGTSDFLVVRYPNGRPAEAAFEDDFRLLDEAGKEINIDNPVQKDEEYRKRFNWFVNIVGNDNVVVQAGDNSKVEVNKTVVNNYYTTVKPDENRPYNEILTRDLLIAIASYYDDAKKFLDKNKSDPKWPQTSALSNLAKGHVTKAYMSVIGYELGRLFAIGKEASDNRMELYMDQSIDIGRETLQLLCFALIADIWKRKKEQDVSLTDETKSNLDNFFSYSSDEYMPLGDYMALFKSLYGTYTDNKLKFPLDELTKFNEHLAPGSDFLQAFDKLHAISRMPDDAKRTLDNVNDAEISLTYILVPLAFLADYSMASVKSIAYENVVSESTRYLHSYVPLSMNNTTANARYNYIDKPVNTDSVVLYKGSYARGVGDCVNLFPFVIDYSALNNDTGSMICFYHSTYTKVDRDTDKEQTHMRYFFSGKDEVIEINYAGILNNREINDLVNEEESRKKLRFDGPFIKMREAKKILLGD